jgi:hypothetical protein
MTSGAMSLRPAWKNLDMCLRCWKMMSVAGLRLRAVVFTLPSND